MGGFLSTQILISRVAQNIRIEFITWQGNDASGQQAVGSGHPYSSFSVSATLNICALPSACCTLFYIGEKLRAI
jgi:hypothetical protein